MPAQYQTVTDGPDPLSWDEYAKRVDTDWKALLDDSTAGEEEFHAFLEMHPCLVPGHDAFEGAGHGNLPAGPGRCAMFSKPPLPYGTTRRVPDFMWITTDSRTQWAVLIEIEDPKKPWLTKSGQGTAKLAQAEHQVLEWRNILSNPENKQQFMDMYGLPSVYSLEFAYCLIYGRRDSVSAVEQMAHRNSIRRSEIHSMTFDRLRPAEPTRNFISIKVKAGKFYAIGVPATLKLDLSLVWRWEKVAGKSAATLASPHFDPVRQKFLADRFDYWERTAPTNLNRTGLPEGE